MPLNQKDLANLLRLIGLTKDTEINCDQCLSLVAEFAERELAGRSVDESLRAVEEHLAICGECREEYEALRKAIKDTGA